MLAELSRFFTYNRSTTASIDISLKKRVSSALVEILKAEILPLAAQMIEATIISRVENLGRRILDLANIYDVDALEHFGKGMIIHGECCDITEIKKDLRALP